MLVLATGNAHADSGLPFQDFNLGPNYQSVNSNLTGASSEGKMYGLHMAFSGSYLDSVLDGRNNRLRFGDYIGAHATLAEANYEADGSQYFVGLGLSLGAQAGLSITDYLHLGARYYLDFRDNKFGSLENAQTLHLDTAALMLRVADIYLEAAAGNGRKAQGNETFRSSRMNVRYVLSDGGYVGAMLDSVKIRYDLTDRQDDVRNIVIQFGLML
jgi:hypothetical protein